MNRFLLFLLCDINAVIIAAQWFYAVVSFRIPSISCCVSNPEFLFYSAIAHQVHHVSSSESHFLTAKYQNQ